ncbi:hypothetical protein Hanom_Chr03g00186851 [Helianthus anomalus]
MFFEKNVFLISGPSPPSVLCPHLHLFSIFFTPRFFHAVFPTGFFYVPFLRALFTI